MPSTIGIVSSSVLEYITIEYLQIGGGGGGGFDAGGGGGAGGYVEGTAQLPLKQFMGQIVGAGGQGGINSAGLYNGQTGENTEELLLLTRQMEQMVVQVVVLVGKTLTLQVRQFKQVQLMELDTVTVVAR
jgi:hypothetical protein